MSGESRVSRTSARIAGVRRSRRNRRVMVRAVGVWVRVMGHYLKETRRRELTSVCHRDTEHGDWRLSRSTEILCVSCLCGFYRRVSCYVSFEILRDRVDQRRDGVARRLNRGLDVRLRRGLRGHRADAGDHGRGQQIGGRLRAQDAHEVAHRRRARERDDVDAPLEQHPVDVRLAFAIGFDRDGAIGHHLGDVGALFAQLVGDQLAADVRVRQQNLLSAHVARFRQHAQHRLRSVLGRGEIDLQPVTAPAAPPSPGRRRTASRRRARADPTGRPAAVR